MTAAVAQIAIPVTAQPSASEPRTGTPDSPPQAAASRLNRTGRAVTITAPLLNGDMNLGDIELTVAPDDTISLPPRRLLDLIAAVVELKTMETLRGALSLLPSVSPGDIAGTGISVTYDPEALALRLGVPDTLRAARGVSLGAMDAELVGSFDAPAGFSAYLNTRLSWDHVERGRRRGFDDPIVFFDGAARIRDFVLESEGLWQPGTRGGDFERHGTRIVYDDVDSILRWTLGDMLTIGEGFQTSVPLAGISVQRSYGLLQPHRSVRPTGRQSFFLRRPSTVEVLVNGQFVRRIRLEPGPYNLSDFPTANAANDIRLNITDDTGHTETLRFNLFFDQDQLAAGCSEFGLFAGLKSRRLGGITYTDDWAASGYYRRGMSESLTLGVNAQAEARGALTGIEAIWASPLGIFAGHAAASRSDDAWGAAGILSFQRDFPSSEGWGGRLNLTAELWSRKFAAPGQSAGAIPFKHRLGASYSQNFGDAIYAAVDVQHARRVDDGPDPLMIRGSFGWRLSDRLNLTGDLFHHRNVQHSDHETGIRVGLTFRLGERSSVRASYDSAYGSSRLSYQHSKGEGVGSYSLGADLERSASGTNFTGNFNYSGNRAELAVSHVSSFGERFGLPTDARTNIRVATSLAYADGSFALGRPVQDSFAIVTAHKTLRGAEVMVDPIDDSYSASTGPLGPALKPNLSAYSDRTITIDAPDAPLGVDLGRGSFRVFPPYRGGYRLQVGSDYYISASGRLLDGQGKPLSLVAGEVFEASRPERDKLPVFTNSAGRFALSGLRPGRWRIEMMADPPLAYVLHIAEGAREALGLGDLSPLDRP